ncbi:uncharacterized protein LOC128853405 [Cuculus canorus]|uniref:uncharacterized protein LOC128853405 n=1 Tax=Cuculus canorus TaxID=55661 RepID=UPI0023AA4E99|nr:uncharacterized protein LOC128853405 [Cuculus canorus]
MAAQPQHRPQPRSCRWQRPRGAERGPFPAKPPVDALRLPDANAFMQSPRRLIWREFLTGFPRLRLNRDSLLRGRKKKRKLKKKKKGRKRDATMRNKSQVAGKYGATLERWIISSLPHGSRFPRPGMRSGNPRGRRRGGAPRDGLVQGEPLAKRARPAAESKGPPRSLGPPSPVPQTFLGRVCPSGASLPQRRGSLCGAGARPSGRCVWNNEWLKADWIFLNKASQFLLSLSSHSLPQPLVRK